MKKIAVFASGNGSNFQAIIDAVKAGNLHAEVKLLVSDRPGAFVIERAKGEGIPVLSFQPKDFPEKAVYESVVLRYLEQLQIELIALAGYMRLIGPTLLAKYEGNMVNIHPSLLPSFPGKDAIGQALRAGATETGVTVHYVDRGMDTGPIIAQRPVKILPDDTKESLQKRIQRVEHDLYPHVLEQIIQQSTLYQTVRRCTHDKKKSIDFCIR